MTRTASEGRAALLVGTVRHTRLRPLVHAFAYPTFCLLLPMRRWSHEPAALPLARNRAAWMSFHDRDHGEGGGDAMAWLDRLLAAHGVHDADGEAWLLTYPRVLGRVFKPVSFWFCHRADGRLRAIVAEVNNTFGERHCYLLDGSAGQPVSWGRTLEAAKVLHVSPFIPVQGGYRFRFARTAERLVARVEHVDAEGPLLLTSIAGRLHPLDAGAKRAVLARMPLLGLGVVARIHWQALKLWLRGVPVHPKPAAPAQPVTRQGCLSAPAPSARGAAQAAPTDPRPPLHPHHALDRLA
ncbi:MAG: DUF1365 domain-containing protein [Rubrivivax sp.]|nr:DUF1365 domain-containing protein [Rubrivivax sp.]